MNKQTPFLPGISPSLFGRRKSHQVELLRRARESARAGTVADYGSLFDDILPADELEAAAGQVRRRSFPEVVTFWAWFSQMLELNASCGKALTLVQSWCAAASLPLPAFDTSAFCRARKRLSEGFLDEVGRMTGRFVAAREGQGELWNGLRVRAIDGTSFKLLDTDENQKEFPQPSSQKPGCGFPVMGVVGVLDLGTGLLSDYVTCGYRDHDARGAYALRGRFQEGDLMLADRAFCSYELMAKLQEEKVESVMRLHQKRECKLDWRRGKKLGSDSRLVVWKRPVNPGRSGITKEEWEALPKEMTIRLVRVAATGRDGKATTIYIATTLLDAAIYPSDEIAALYAERWKIEVKFRDIKTTMGLEELRVRTPEMARKTMRVVQLAYNLIKARQRSAIEGGNTPIDHVAFKATIDVLTEFRTAFAGLLNRPRRMDRQRAMLGDRIGERLLRIRPDRSEPRAIKRRPKPFQYLSAPRASFVEIQHRSHYKKIAQVRAILD